MDFSFSAYQIAEMAADVEDASFAFYSSWADSTDDAAVKDLFSSLAFQEAAHKRAFAGMAQDFKQTERVYEYAIDICGILQHTLDNLKKNTFNTESSSRAADIKEALDVACRAEETAVRIYTEIHKTSLERFHKVLNDIIKVEASHLRLVTGMRERFAATGSLLPPKG